MSRALTLGHDSLIEPWRARFACVFAVNVCVCVCVCTSKCVHVCVCVFFTLGLRPARAQFRENKFKGFNPLNIG